MRYYRTLIIQLMIMRGNGKTASRINHQTHKTMLISEFIKRTGYKPTDAEFESITKAYNATSADKDEFCSAWRETHQSKIMAQEEHARNRRRIDAQKAHVKGLEKSLAETISFVEEINRHNIYEESRRVWNERVERDRAELKREQDYLELLQAVMSI